MDFEAIKKAAQAYGPDMTRFLRDMIAIPSESCEEKGVAHRIAEEMKKLGYDKVEFDALCVRSVFCHAHVAAKNGSRSFAPCAAQIFQTIFNIL